MKRPIADVYLGGGRGEREREREREKERRKDRKEGRGVEKNGHGRKRAR